MICIKLQYTLHGFYKIITAPPHWKLYRYIIGDYCYNICWQHALPLTYNSVVPITRSCEWAAPSQARLYWWNSLLARTRKRTTTDSLTWFVTKLVTLTTSDILDDFVKTFTHPLWSYNINIKLKNLYVITKP